MLGSHEEKLCCAISDLASTVWGGAEEGSHGGDQAATQAEQKKLQDGGHRCTCRGLHETEVVWGGEDLDPLVTTKSESMQCDHPNHTVSVTTFSDMDCPAWALRSAGMRRRCDTWRSWLKPSPEIHDPFYPRRSISGHLHLCHTHLPRVKESSPTGPGLHWKSPNATQQQDPAVLGELWCPAQHTEDSEPENQARPQPRLPRSALSPLGCHHKQAFIRPGAFTLEVVGYLME